MFTDFIGKKQLKQRKGEILDLFRLTFGRDFDKEMWDWFYFQNPAGDPAISLYYENDILLGHYAAVPIKLTCYGQPIIGYRSMTTMVHPDGRGKGLFVELARRCYALLQEANVPLILGFPNEQSAPGFAKHLGWTVLHGDLIVDIVGSAIQRDPQLRSAIIKQGDISWDHNDETQMIWRTSAPGARFKNEPGLIMKEYDGIWNILHLSEDGVERLDPNTRYRVSVDNEYSDLATTNDSAFEYRFGFRIFDDSLGAMTFRKELILSDVF